MTTKQIHNKDSEQEIIAKPNPQDTRKKHRKKTAIGSLWPQIKLRGVCEKSGTESCREDDSIRICLGRDVGTSFSLATEQPVICTNVDRGVAKAEDFFDLFHLAHRYVCLPL